MIKMFVLKYTGISFNLFTNGESYIGRITKKGSIYAFNDENHWSAVVQTNFAHNRLANFFEVDDTFYVDNYKEALAYPLNVDASNWGVDIKKILSGAKFTFRLYFTAADIEYTGKVILDDGKAVDLVTYWTSPVDGEEMSSSYSNTAITSSLSELVKNVIEDGLWIIESIELN